MAEAIASRMDAARIRTRFWRRAVRVAPCDARHEDIRDFERLIEELLKKAEWMDRQLREVTEERDRLKEENERLRGE